MKINQEKITQWVHEGRGQGHGPAYIPWIKITRRGSPSGGNLQFRYIPQLERHLHLFSANELHIAILLMWLGVADLRDEFPCWPWPHPHPLYLHPNYQPSIVPWSEGTIVCAEEIGIKHPVFPSTRILHIPTIDLLATVTFGLSPRAVAFAIKPDETESPLDANDLSKLAIQKEYCLRLDIPWKLLSSSLIPETLKSNLQILIHYSGALDDATSVKKWGRYLEILNKHLSCSCSINDTLRLAEEATGFHRAVVLAFFHRALWFRKTNIDLRQPIVMSAPPILSDQSWVQATIDCLLGNDND